jgi:uncharacterized phage protein gp47/JayE
MPLEKLANTLNVPGRDQERDRYLRDYSLRKPGVPTGPKTEPYTDASVMADQTAVLYADAILIANSCTRSTRTSSQIDDDLEEHGSSRLPPVGASGSVAIGASPGGTTIFAGDEFTINSLRYQCAETALYQDGAEVPITGIDTGPGTDQPAGALGKWSANRPGCDPVATVVEQADGSGLIGGSDVESDAQAILRLDNLDADPPASGNDAEYQALIVRAPNVAIQAAFTIPGIKGPGSKGVMFTLRPSSPGKSRIPTSTHRAAVKAWVRGQMPADDGYYDCALVVNPIPVNLKGTWALGAAGWSDALPWPAYQATPIAVDGGQPNTATTIYLTGNDGSTPGPSAGQSIGVFELASLEFHRKKILSVATSGTDWVLTIDTTNGVSDTSYVPTGGQVVCPWSDSLTSVAIAVVSYFDTLGPGEQVSSFVDPGLRQRRSPASPVAWPSVISNRLVLPLFTIAEVGDVALLDPAIPYATPVGTPGVSSFLTTIAGLAIFPE